MNGPRVLSPTLYIVEIVFHAQMKPKAKCEAALDFVISIAFG